MKLVSLVGWARFALAILLTLVTLTIPQPAHALSCILSTPASKGAHIDESFQHITPSPSGFFALHWNASGDSALAAAEVPAILAALDSARACYRQLPGSWDIPLGSRSAYPVLAVRQDAPGATTLPFSVDGVDGLTWIQLSNDLSGWEGDAHILRDVTCAHEVFHALQFAQGADLRDLAFYEASAVWAEDHCFPQHDDWAWRYLPHLLSSLDAPWNELDGLREYGAGAVVKHTLDGDWSACRNALLGADAQRRCWPLFLAGLDDPQTRMANCLAELLMAGSHELLPWRVPELAQCQPLERPASLELRPGLALPAQAAELIGLSWGAFPVATNGAALPQCGELEPYLTEGLGATPMPCDSVGAVYTGQWLLLVNCSEAPRDGLHALQWQASNGLQIWPNPGGSERWLRMGESTRQVEICNLLGQRLVLWTAPDASAGPFRLSLPPAAGGTLLLREWPHGKTCAITQLP